MSPLETILARDHRSLDPAVLFPPTRTTSATIIRNTTGVMIDLPVTTTTTGVETANVIETEKEIVKEIVIEKGIANETENEKEATIVTLDLDLVVETTETIALTDVILDLVALTLMVALRRLHHRHRLLQTEAAAPATMVLLVDEIPLSESLLLLPSPEHKTNTQRQQQQQGQHCFSFSTQQSDQIQIRSTNSFILSSCNPNIEQEGGGSPKQGNNVERIYPNVSSSYALRHTSASFSKYPFEVDQAMRSEDEEMRR